MLWLGFSSPPQLFFMLMDQNEITGYFLQFSENPVLKLFMWAQQRIVNREVKYIFNSSTQFKCHDWECSLFIERKKVTVNWSMCKFNWVICFTFEITFFFLRETETKPATDEAIIRKEHGTELKASQKASDILMKSKSHFCPGRFFISLKSKNLWSQLLFLSRQLNLPYT